MFTHYRTQGFIFGKEDLGENDQVLSIFTRDFGRLEILGRAIRKIQSKLRSGSNLFNLSEIEFIQGKAFKTLTDAITLKNFKNIRSDLKKLKFAYQISEVFDKLVGREEKDKRIWNLIIKIFAILNRYQLPTISYQLLYYYFLWNLFSFLGYQPELQKCLVCQKKLFPKDIYFSSEEGGTICSQCKNKLKSSLKVEADIIKVLRLILKRDLATLLRLKIEKSEIAQIKEISENYINHKAIKSI